MAHCLDHPQRTLDWYHKPFAQFTAHNLTELGLCVALCFADVVGLVEWTLVQCHEHGPCQVAHIDERQHLFLEAYGEVKSSLDALHHQVVVALVRAVHACATEYSVGQPRLLHLQPGFGLEFAGPISGVGGWHIVGFEWSVVHLIARSHDTEAAHHQEHSGHRIDVAQRLGHQP